MALVELGVRVTEAMAAAVRDHEVLSNATTQILLQLYLRGPQQPSQLATGLGLSRPQISKLLRRLEEEQLIDRDVGVDRDGRVRTVTLTTTGHEVIDAADQILQRGFDDIADVSRTVQTFLQRTAPVLDEPDTRQQPHPLVGNSAV